MTNWKENKYPFKNFTEKLTQEWISCDFSKKETREWLESDLQPTDSSFAKWLKDELNFNAEDFFDCDDQDLRIQYQKHLENNQNKDWRNIHEDFTSKLQKSWEERSFGYEQVKEWVEAGMKPRDAGFCAWLKYKKNVNVEWVLERNSKELKEEYIEYLETKVDNIDEGKTEKIWRNIHPKFTKKIEKRWKDEGFSYEWTKELIKVGYQPNDYDFIAYMLDVLNYGERDILDCVRDKSLRKQYESHLKENNYIEEGYLDADSSNDEESEEESGDDSSVKEWNQEWKFIEEEWKYHGFGHEEIERCSSLGFSVNQASFLRWLTREKKWDDSSLHKVLISGIRTKKEKRLWKKYSEEYVNWEGIHPSFNPELENEWGELSAVYYQHQGTIERMEDYHFARWLYKNKTPKQIKENIMKLKKEFVESFVNETWKDIHTNFNKSLKNQWESKGFDYEETKKWITVGKLNPDEPELADYLKKEKKYSPFLLSSNLEGFRKEFYSVQNHLDKNYSFEERRNVKELKIESKLTGCLVIKDWKNLEKIDCQWNRITGLKITNCPKITEIFFSENHLEYLLIKDCPNICKINVSKNKLKSLDFLNNLDYKKLISLNISNNNFLPYDLSIFKKFINLESLFISNNLFYGSLKPLKDLSRLGSFSKGLGTPLGIENTNLDSDLEYLPLGVKGFGVLKEGKINCPKIDKELKDYLYSSPVNVSSSGYTVDFSYYDFQAWRENQPFYNQIAGTLQNLGYSNLSEITQSVFFNFRAGTFEGKLHDLVSLLQINKVLFETKEKEINSLEIRIQELTSLIKKQKEKIVNAYLYFSSEKELLQKLVKSYLEFTNAKKRQLDNISEHHGQFSKFYEKLESELSENSIQEVKKILTDCEELISWELELETKSIDKSLLLRKFLHIDDNYQKEKKLITYHNRVIQELTDSERNIVKPNLKYLISKGGSSEVYYGEWKLQDVAVKKLNIDGTFQNEIWEITNEIYILKNLRSEYVVQYYETYFDNQEFLIVMEYAKNGTLTNFINDNKHKEHDWGFNTDLIRQIASGLAYIHHENIIHRDLKSMNILLTNNYQQAKISDFGLSKIKSFGSSQSKSDIVGTLRWMAPELLRGEKYSEQSDIYSLGMVIWEIAAKCTMPFKDVNDGDVYLFIISNGKETIPDNAPKNILSIVEKSWRDNPNERITLINMLEMIRNDALNVPTTYSSQLLGISNIPEPKSSEEVYSSTMSVDSYEPLYKDVKKLTTGETPSCTNETQLRQERQDYQQFQSHQETSPK